MKKISHYIFITVVVVLPLLFSKCNKEPEPNNQPSNTSPSFSFDFRGNPLYRWTATKIDTPEIVPSCCTIFVFTNNGSSVYSQSLKDTYPDLTEKVYIMLITTDLQTGRYALKYGPGTQGMAELVINQTAASNSPKADSSYRISEIGPESYFQIDKIENDKMSGSFFLYIFQPITGAPSLRILECKDGKFQNIAIK